MRVIRVLGAAALVVLVLLGVVAANYGSISLRNTGQQHFDAILVLGSPANPDGSVSPEERSRVTEAVREFQAGVAPTMILTGGAAHNGFVEAQVMAGLAEREGVPPAAILEEPRARNTVENVFYSDAILREHGWRSVEVVSSRSHLPRAALILRHYPLQWRLHAAPWPGEFTASRIRTIYWYEALDCLRLRVLGFPASPFLPVR